MSKHLTRRSINTAMSQTLLESYFNRLAQKKIDNEKINSNGSKVFSTRKRNI